MLNRSDMDTRDESKDENPGALVTVMPKQSASPFDKNLALLIAVSFSSSPSVKKENSDASVKITKKSNKPVLMYLPSDIWLAILPFLNLEFDLKNCRALSYRVDRPLGIFFQAHLRGVRDIRLKQLLQYVVCGNQIEAEKIIESDLGLLLMRGTVEDYSFGMDEENHRKNQGTAYELALVRAEDEIMAAMIHSYLITFPEGRIEIAAQRWQAIDKMRKSRDSAALHKIVNTIEVASEEDCYNASEVDKTIQNILYVFEKIETEEDAGKRDKLKKIILAIAKADSETDFEMAFDELKNYLYENAIIESPTFNFAVLKAIFQFRNFMEPRGIISTGKQFNAGLLDEAFKLFNKKYQPFGNSWESTKNKLFWQKVIGYIQRFSPANYGQAFAQNMSYIAEDGKKLKRSFKFWHCWPDENILFFPLDSDPRFRLGYDYAAADLWQGWALWRVCPRSSRREPTGRLFTNLCHAKTTSLQCIKPQRDNLSKKSDTDVLVAQIIKSCKQDYEKKKPFAHSTFLKRLPADGKISYSELSLYVLGNQRSRTARFFVNSKVERLIEGDFKNFWNKYLSEYKFSIFQRSHLIEKFIMGQVNTIEDIANYASSGSTRTHKILKHWSRS
jgi:hypothetical protein